MLHAKHLVTSAETYLSREGCLLTFRSQLLYPRESESVGLRHTYQFQPYLLAVCLSGDLPRRLQEARTNIKDAPDARHNSQFAELEKVASFSYPRVNSSNIPCEATQNQCACSFHLHHEAHFNSFYRAPDYPFMEQ
jgi:hypothetical protein